jgi:hypothetical protein
MKNTQTTAQTNKVSPKHLNRKNLIITLLFVVVIAGLGVFLSKDLPLRERYTATVNELEEVANETLSPAGAVRQPNEEKRGNGLLDSIFNCGVDVRCPTALVRWHIPIESGKEVEFLEAILQNQGYTVTSRGVNGCSRLSEGGSCSVTGKKGELTMGINLNDTNSNSPAPSNDVSPKVWRVVSLRITDYAQ